MASKTDRATTAAIKLRKQVGSRLQKVRQSLDLTQVQVAERLGYQYFTFVAQIEQGRSRIPPDDWTSWAKLYKQDPVAFSRMLLRHYDPHVYAACFPTAVGEKEEPDAKSKKPSPLEQK